MVSLPNLSSGTGISNDVINGTLLIKIFSLLFKKNCISTMFEHIVRHAGKCSGMARKSR